MMALALIDAKIFGTNKIATTGAATWKKPHALHAEYQGKGVPTWKQECSKGKFMEAWLLLAQRQIDLLQRTFGLEYKDFNNLPETERKMSHFLNFENAQNFRRFRSEI